MGLLSKFNPTIRASLILALALILVLGGSYFFFVRNKTRYFTERNLRHLSLIGRQVESSIRSHERVLKSFAKAAPEELQEAAIDPDVTKAQLRTVQALRSEIRVEQLAPEQGSVEPPPEEQLTEAELATTPASSELKRQQDEWVKLERRIVENIPEEDKAAALEKKWTKLVPLFEEVSVTQCRWPDLVGQFMPGTPPPFHLDEGETLSLLDGPWLHIVVAGEPITEMPEKRDGETDEAAATTGDEPAADASAGWPAIRVCARIRLENLLRPIFEPDIFDALLLARTSGEVVYQNAVSELVATRLDHLPGIARGDEASPSFAAFSHTTQVLDVTLSGRAYKLFLQPQSIPSLLATSGQAPAIDGWVVAGLVDSQRFRVTSLKFSPTLMVTLSAAVLLLAFSYPFLKLWLLGHRQRLRLRDALLIGISVLLGLAVSTVVLLDVAAYGAAKHRADQQLKTLADEIETQVEREVSCVYCQLEFLERPALEIYRSLVDAGSLSRQYPNLLSDSQMFPPGESPYPFLNRLYLIADTGEQLIKWDVDSRVTPLVSLDRRDYVRELRADGGWKPGSERCCEECHAESGERYYLESIIAWTDGTRQAVVSKRLGEEDLGEEDRVPDDDKRPEIVAMALPMLSLIDPVLPPGFGFAVVDDEGTALFHSESRLNLLHNLITESDGDRVLRAAIVARGQASLDLRYGGRDRRVFVRPMESFPWALVTFVDKDLLRMANVETLFVSNVFLFLYGGGCLLLTLGILLFHPGYRAPWLWPQVRVYRGLSVFLILLSALFGIAICLLDDVTQLAMLGFLLPALALDVSYLNLSWKRRDRPQWTLAAATGVALASAIVALWSSPQDPDVIYLWTAFFLKIALLGLVWVVLRCLGKRWDEEGGRERKSRVSLAWAHSWVIFFLLIIVAVLPAAAFFKAAHSVSSETLLKYGQFHLARDLEERWHRIRKSYSDEVGEGKGNVRDRRASLTEPFDVYNEFFFDTQLTLRPADGRRDRANKAPWYRQLTNRILAEVLPDYSRQVAEMRQLLQSEVGHTDWCRYRDVKSRQLTLDKHHFGDGQVLRIESELPPFTDWEMAICVCLAALVLLGALVWIARFVVRRILLADLVPPRWIGDDGKLSPHAIGPLLLVCERPSDHVAEERFFVLDVVKDLESAPWRAELTERIRAKPLERVLVKGFDQRLDDPALTRRKLALLEELTRDLNRTVVIVSRSDPAAIKAALTGAGDDETAELRRRCVEILAGFAVFDLNWQRRQQDARKAAAPRPAARPALFTNLRRPRWRDLRRWLSFEPFRRLFGLRGSGAAQALERECASDPFLAELRDELGSLVAETPEGPDPLTREQLLEEVGERAEDYYRGLWETCSPDEKLALGHIADVGLVNAKNHRAVRRLLARGLLRRAPHPVVMNESFRRYLLSDACRQEVRKLEIDPGSAWSRLRWPLFLVLLGTLIFIAVTQQELLNTTMALLTGTAAAIPAVLRLFGLFGPSVRDDGS